MNGVTRHCLPALLIMSMAGAGALAQQPGTAPAKPATPGASSPAAKPGAANPGQPPASTPSAKPQDKAPAPPPGMSEADMKACMDAATPGPMHAFLTEAAGTWSGKVKTWMAAGTEPTMSECTTVITPMMDGRFTRCETKGEMPGMGVFEGFGIYGYDNVSKKFQSTWADNMGTGMMTGTGELSADGKTLSWTCTYNCPIQKGPITMREVERRTGKDTTTLEMYGPDRATGKEYKVMEIKMTRTSGSTPASTPASNGGTPKKATN